VVVTAMTSVPGHGPYRSSFTVAEKGSTAPVTIFTCEFVPPDGDHCFIGPAGEGIESITVGKQSWTRLGKGAPWQPDTDDSADPPASVPRAGDLVSATEKASTSRARRRFAVVVKDTPKNSSGTVTVDRQGRLLSLSVAGAQGTATFVFAYDATIRITAPV
jgi:hypothetical protein